MKMVERYFKLVNQKNNHYSFSGGYQKNIGYNDLLIKDFLGNIKRFFESEYDVENLKKLFSQLRDLGWGYRWGNKTDDKSEGLRKYVGEFVYDIFHVIIGHKIAENDDMLRFELLNMFNEYIETQDNVPKDNIAFKVFIEKIKEKITKDEFGSNAKGYYPAIIKVYFLIFGFQVFSDRVSEFELKELHLPIMKKLRESFPRLYMGFKQEFYDQEKLPENKITKLQLEGRKIIDNFLPSNMSYVYENNALEYYFGGENYGSRIELNQFNENSDKITNQEI